MAWTSLPHSNSEYMDLALDRDRGLARMRRTERSITLSSAPTVITRFVQDLDRLIPPASRKSLRLLVDSREAPRAEPQLEETLSSRMNPLMTHFAAVAVLIKTPIGILQMRRLLRGWSTPADVFSDEAEALIWLLRHPLSAF